MSFVAISQCNIRCVTILTDSLYDVMSCDVSRAIKSNAESKHNVILQLNINAFFEISSVAYAFNPFAFCCVEIFQGEQEYFGHFIVFFRFLCFGFEFRFNLFLEDFLSNTKSTHARKQFYLPLTACLSFLCLIKQNNNRSYF